ELALSDPADCGCDHRRGTQPVPVLSLRTAAVDDGELDASPGHTAAYPRSRAVPAGATIRGAGARAAPLRHQGPRDRAHHPQLLVPAESACQRAATTETLRHVDSPAPLGDQVG